MSDSEEERECPPCPAPFIRLPADTREVLDADEEVGKPSPNHRRLLRLFGPG